MSSSTGGIDSGKDAVEGAPAPSAEDNGHNPQSEQPPREGQDTAAEKEDADARPSSPTQESGAISQQYLYAHPQLTPQLSGGYYMGYPQQRVTPEPPSPDVASFLHQQALAHQSGQVMSNIFGSSQYNGVPQPPLTPTRTGINVPASPLFPRATNNTAGLPAVSLDQQHPVDASRLNAAAPPSPSVYLSPPLLPAGVYQGYGAAAASGNYNNVNGSSGNNANTGNSPEDSGTGWPEGSQPRHQQQQQQQQQQHNLYQQASPNLQSVQGQFPGGGANMAASGNYRANSFDEMLPPSLLDQQEQSPVTYSPYGAAANQGASGGTLFAHQQPWGYGASGDMYAVPGSPVQPRQNPNVPPHTMSGQPPPFAGGPPVPGGMRPMGHFGGQPAGMPPYYPATSPGPPIQTTASNKGPDGANLFIFHIPNHFTNLDMYHLFARYGNLLSVRIMVEKDTGRSRGFGFVSYDNPESAAMAIKELNGFAIGNKRLKVQHKQIRASDQRPDHQQNYNPADSLPPSNPNRWFDSQQPPKPDSALDGRSEGSSGTPQTGQLGDDNSNAPSNPSSGPKDPTQDPSSGGGVDIALAAGGGGPLNPLGNLESMRSALPDVSG